MIIIITFFRLPLEFDSFLLLDLVEFIFKDSVRLLSWMRLEELFFQIGTLFRNSLNAGLHVGVEDASLLHLVCLNRPRV